MYGNPTCMIVPWWKVPAADTPQHNPHSHEDTMDTNTTENTVTSTIESRFPDIDIADGEHYAGLARDHDTGAWHHLVLLPAVPDKALTWQQAIDWAKSVGGELPTRFESALLYANFRDQVDHDFWYWTATQHEREPSWAWGQNFFLYGVQGYVLKDGHHRARAVRRVPV